MNTNTPQRDSRGAVIVTRVSTGEQDKHGTSPETQLAACRAKAAQLGTRIVAEYYDAAVSGAFLLMREGMQAALADISAGRADTLICPNISRYSRDVEHQQAIKKAVRAAGGRVVFCDMDFDDTPEGDLAFNIMGGFAEYERQVIRKRSMDGKRRRAEEGRQPCRTWVPYGYHVPTKSDVLRGLYPAEQLGRYLSVDAEVPVVVRIFDSYARGAHTLRGLARELNAEGVPTPRAGAHWHPTTLRHILTNPIYVGKAAFGRRRCRADEGRLLRTHWRTGRPLTTPRYQVDVPEEEWTVIEAPAIVEQAAWDAAQRRLSANRTVSGGNPKRVHMLSGRVLCPVCGGSMFRWTAPNRPAALSCLRHRNEKQAAGGIVCVGTRYPVEMVERATVRAITDALERPEVIAAARAAYEDHAGGRSRAGNMMAESARVEAALAEIQAQEAAAVQAQIAGIRAGAPPEAYATVFAGLAARRSELEEQRAALTRNVRQPGGQALSTETFSPSRVWEDVRLALTSPDIPGAAKRDALGLLVEKVIPRRDGAEVHFLPGVFGAQSDSVQNTSTRFTPS